MSEPQILAVLIICIGIAVCLTVGAWLVVRATLNPSARIGARARARYEEIQDQLILESERLRFEAERTGSDDAPTGADRAEPDGDDTGAEAGDPRPGETEADDDDPGNRSP